jgi:hypothetical protein
LLGKIGIHGSLGANINTFKALMIGDHEMYKKIKSKVLSSN